MDSLTRSKAGAEPAPATKLFDQDFFRLASKCPVEAWLAFLGHRWNALILYHLNLGPKKFGGILYCLPDVTPKVLTERLVQLERWGLICRPGAVRGAPYQLTPKGGELMPILDAIELWSRDFPKVELSR